jgi:hypothetical protein
MTQLLSPSTLSLNSELQLPFPTKVWRYQFDISLIFINIMYIINIMHIFFSQDLFSWQGYNEQELLTTVI